MEELNIKKESLKLINEEIVDNETDDEETDTILRKALHDVLREAEVLRANIKNLQMKTDKLMGNHEKKMEQNLNNIKVTNELYFGIDIYVDKFMHRIYKDFIEGRNTLLDWFRHV